MAGTISDRTKGQRSPISRRKGNEVRGSRGRDEAASVQTEVCTGR